MCTEGAFQGQFSTVDFKTCPDSQKTFSQDRYLKAQADPVLG